MLTLLEKLHKESEEKKDSKRFHLDSDVRYCAEGKYVTMMIMTVDSFIRNPTRTTSFHASEFNLHFETLLNELM